MALCVLSAFLGAGAGVLARRGAGGDAVGPAARVSGAAPAVTEAGGAGGLGERTTLFAKRFPALFLLESLSNAHPDGAMVESALLHLAPYDLKEALRYHDLFEGKDVLRPEFTQVAFLFRAAELRPGLLPEILAALPPGCPEARQVADHHISTCITFELPAAVRAWDVITQKFSMPEITSMARWMFQHLESLDNAFGAKFCGWILENLAKEDDLFRKAAISLVKFHQSIPGAAADDPRVAQAVLIFKYPNPELILAQMDAIKSDPAAVKSVTNEWLSGIAMVSPKDAFDLINQLPVEDRQESLVRLLPELYDSRDPAKYAEVAHMAIANAGLYFHDPKVKADFIKDSLGRLVEQSPDEAFKVIALLPQEEQAAPLISTAGAWARSDPFGYAQWLNSQGSYSDRSVSALISAIPDDPASALVWADRISNPAAKTRVLQNLDEIWSRIDSGVSAAIKQKLSEPPPP
jgi:hypothetical protein